MHSLASALRRKVENLHVQALLVGTNNPPQYRHPNHNSARRPEISLQVQSLPIDDYRQQTLSHASASTVQTRAPEHRGLQAGFFWQDLCRPTLLAGRIHALYSAKELCDGWYDFWCMTHVPPYLPSNPTKDTLVDSINGQRITREVQVGAIEHGRWRHD
jgi:hypothetical protein